MILCPEDWGRIVIIRANVSFWQYQYCQWLWDVPAMLCGNSNFISIVSYRNYPQNLFWCNQTLILSFFILLSFAWLNNYCVISSWHSLSSLSLMIYIWLMQVNPHNQLMMRMCYGRSHFSLQLNLLAGRAYRGHTAKVLLEQIVKGHKLVVTSSCEPLLLIMG